MNFSSRSRPPQPNQETRSWTRVHFLEWPMLDIRSETKAQEIAGPCANFSGLASSRTAPSPWSFAAGSLELSEVWLASLRRSSFVWVSTCSAMRSHTRWMRRPREFFSLRCALPWPPFYSITWSSLGTGNGREHGVSSARNSREVSLLDNLPVMQFVPCRYVGQRPHADFILVGRPSA